MYFNFSVSRIKLNNYYHYFSMPPPPFSACILGTIRFLVLSNLTGSKQTCLMTEMKVETVKTQKLKRRAHQQVQVMSPKQKVRE